MRGIFRKKITDEIEALAIKLSKLNDQLQAFDRSDNQDQKHYLTEVGKVLTAPEAYGIHTPEDRATFDAAVL